jgi:hypothetical protein
VSRFECESTHDRLFRRIAAELDTSEAAVRSRFCRRARKPVSDQSLHVPGIALPGNLQEVDAEQQHLK